MLRDPQCRVNAGGACMTAGPEPWMPQSCGCGQPHDSARRAPRSCRGWTRGLVLPAGLALLAFAGCADDDSPTGSDTPPDIFEVGDTVSVALDRPAGGSYSDPTAGLDFVFPEDAAGRLTYGELLSAPSRNRSGGRGLYLEFEGTGEAQLRVPCAQGEVTFLLCYGEPYGSWGSATTEHWFALPVADTLRSLAGDSLLIRLGQLVPGGAAPCEASFAHWLFTLPAESAEALAFQAAVAQARQFLAVWLDSLDEPLRDACRQRMETELPPIFYPDADYYTGFARVCPSGRMLPAARIGLGPQITAQGIAHQLGHYCMHVLAGDEAYLTLEDRIPRDQGIGTYQSGRVSVIEDYAHYHEYLLTGSIAGAGDPGEPASFFPSRPDPGTVDVPSVEGYGCLLLHALTRHDSSMVALNGDPVTVPALGLDYACLAQEILAHAPATATHLWWVIDDYLGSSGRTACLRLLAAATGWAYTGVGTVAGASGTIAGARLWNVVEHDGREYRASENPVFSGVDGSFTMHPLFPQTSRIRVETPADTFEFETTVIPQQLTDAPRYFGDVSAWARLDALEKVRVELHLEFAAQPEDSAAGRTCSFSSGTMLKSPTLVFETDRIHLDAPYVVSCGNPPEPCWTVDSLSLAYSLETGEISEAHVRISSAADPPTTLSIRPRGSIRAAMEGCNTVYFLRFDPGSPAELGEHLLLSYWEPETGAHTEADLRGGNQALVVRAWKG